MIQPIASRPRLRLSLAVIGGLVGCTVDSNADIGGTDAATNMTTVSTTMTTAATEPDSSSTADSAAETNVGPVDFSTDLLPILTGQCSMDANGGSCHMPGGTWAFLDLTESMAYMSLLEGDPTESILHYAEPMDPDNSYLLYKLRGTQSMAPGGGSGVQMPQPPAGVENMPLSDGEIAMFQAWIEQGAAE